MYLLRSCFIFSTVSTIIGGLTLQSNVILGHMNDKKIVITGVNGFVGEHLSRHLRDLGFHIIGIGREEKLNGPIASLIDTYYRVDMFKSEEFADVDLQNVQAIIHLAGLASVADSFKNPDLYKTGNAIITENLLKLAKSQNFKGRIVVISSGALYDPNQPMPIIEESSVIENSPYAVGKIAAEKVSIDYKNNGLDVVIVRPFNHIGPGQGTGFLLPDLYAQIEQAKKNGDKTISVGNLNSKREFTDVLDIVVAYGLLATAESLNHEIYILSSGASHSGQEILDYLKTATEWTGSAVIDESRIRPNDPADIIGDSSRLKNELGWNPSIPLEKTIQDFVDYNK